MTLSSSPQKSIIIIIIIIIILIFNNNVRACVSHGIPTHMFLKNQIIPKFYSIIASYLNAACRKIVKKYSATFFLLIPLTENPRKYHYLKPCQHCRRKVRLSPKTARQRRQSPNSATVAEFGDSRTFLRQSLFSATNCRRNRRL